MSPSPLEDPTDLVGRWTLVRDVDDRRAGERHRIEGVLELVQVAPDRLSWTEEARWQRASGAVDVRRGLWLERDGEADWWVRFEDGRDFHPWRPGRSVVHPCAPDTYRGVVAGTPAGWSVVWEVTGPRKDYTMTTRLTRPAD